MLFIQLKEELTNLTIAAQLLLNNKGVAIHQSQCSLVRETAASFCMVWFSYSWR
jgi:hypothetical protein